MLSFLHILTLAAILMVPGLVSATTNAVQEARQDRVESKVVFESEIQSAPSKEELRAENIEEVANKLSNFQSRITSVENAIEPVPWTVGAWGSCSKSCGGGSQTRVVTCSKGNESLCIGPKPATAQACNLNFCSWSVGSWGGCSKSCGGGVQYRSVTCSGSSCNPSTKPASSRTCNTQSCYGVWKTGSWGACSGAQCVPGGTQTRSVWCSTSSCNPSTRPTSSQSCYNTGPCGCGCGCGGCG